MLKNLARNLFIVKNHLSGQARSFCKVMEAESKTVTFLNQETAQKVDEELMQQHGYSLEALMELADFIKGLSVAQAINDCNHKYHGSSLKKILVMIGPGNNGGDGYVTANHLKQFGYDPQILIFKKPEKPLYINLSRVCEANNIKVSNYQDENVQYGFNKLINEECDMIVDAIFGFSFKGPIKSPYDKVLNELKSVKKPIFSIDIPSGWNVEEGNVYDLFVPSYVISLTLPKDCMKNFQGKHYLGGRFVPQKMIEKYNWKIPKYPSSQQFIEIAE